MKERKRRDEEEHEITEREKRAWQEGKGRTPAAPPELSRSEQKIFLKLIKELKGDGVFMRLLSLGRPEILYWRERLAVQNQDDARTLLRSMEAEDIDNELSAVEENSRQQRAASEMANQRLQEFEAQRLTESNDRRDAVLKDLDPVELKEEDARRQKRLAKQIEDAENPAAGEDEWSLVLDGTHDNDQIRLFHNDIIHRGMMFCTQKYNTSAKSIRRESIRLRLGVDWDRVRR